MAKRYPAFTAFLGFIIWDNYCTVFTLFSSSWGQKMGLPLWYLFFIISLPSADSSISPPPSLHNAAVAYHIIRFLKFRTLMKQTYAGHSTTGLSELLYCPGGSQVFSLIPLRPPLKPHGLGYSRRSWLCSSFSSGGTRPRWLACTAPAMHSLTCSTTSTTTF